MLLLEVFVFEPSNAAILSFDSRHTADELLKPKPQVLMQTSVPRRDHRNGLQLGSDLAVEVSEALRARA